MAPQIAAYGSWSSPITADQIVKGTIRLGQTAWDGSDLYWVEGRPTEAGRMVLVQRNDQGQVQDRLAAPWNVRTRVHEYGGGAFWVANGGIIFAHFADQRLYRYLPDHDPEPLTPESGSQLRYADGVWDPWQQRILCVREDHRDPNQEPINTLVAIPLGDPEAGQILVSGEDFYAYPRLSADGSYLAWISWNHPQMPWDGTELWIAAVQPDGSLGSRQRIAGGSAESVLQPEWSADGMLYFISDRSGWWNLYRWRQDQIESITAMEAEFGQPLWNLGQSTYGLTATGSIICTYTQNGIDQLARLDPDTGKLDPFELPYTSISDITVGSHTVVVKAGSPTEFAALVELDLETGAITILRRSAAIEIDPSFFSIPEIIEFPTAQGQIAYGIFYPPCHPHYNAPAEDRPPLLVKSHGGPTSAASAMLNLGIQYWTSRGIAILDVNYRGSTGYGRAYREQLKGQWGIADVDDCVYGAQALMDQGRVDPERLAIEGGSAGGYTTLCVLTFRDQFKAGASRYGVSDLEALVRDTHKFEARYLDSLIGPYPEQQQLYQQRSPIHYADQLACPVIFLQGLEDKIVPPNQAEVMVEILRQKGLPVAYVAFEGEQHGFRQAATIKRALEAELYFFAKVFGFELADPIDPIQIENLKA